MTDLLKTLESARPDDDLLHSHLSQERDARITARIAAAPTRHSTVPWKRPAAWLMAAAVAVGILVGPSLAGSDDAAARADLTELALAAVNTDGAAIAEGTFLHVKTESIQRNSAIFDDGKTLDTNREKWVRWDGRTWAIDTRPSAGWHEYQVFPVNDWFTPERAASLPDTAPELRAHLDETVTGSNSHEEAVYVAVTDWVRSNLLPPRTLAAALEVLAGVEGVETEDVTVRGRDAVEVSFHRFWSDLVASESMIIDRQTARTISERSSDPTGTYESDTVLVEVVDEIPAQVLRDFAQAKDDVRVYDDGHTPTKGDL